MKFDHYQFTICEHFIAALFNGDNSGLTDREAEQLDEFEAQVLELVRNKGCEGGHWSIDDDSEPYYGHCDVVNMRGTVQDIEYMFPIA